MKQPRKVLGLPVRLETVAVVVYLTVLLGFAARYLTPILFRTWFFSSDEYVFAAEVIRFSNLDFHQRFFDNPGTPFMMLNAAVWIVIYAGSRALGLMPPDTRIDAFTFHHMPLLFTSMRAATLVFFLISAVLFFRLYARLAGLASAAVATLLLVFAPIYCYYTSFVRTESLALVCILCALLVVERAMAKDGADWERAPGPGDYATIAGLLCGVAAGARLHSMTAALPVLFTILWLQRRPPQAEYPLWIMLRNRGYTGEVHHFYIENDSARLQTTPLTPCVIVTTRGKPPAAIREQYPFLSDQGELMVLSTSDLKPARGTAFHEQRE